MNCFYSKRWSKVKLFSYKVQTVFTSCFREFMKISWKVKTTYNIVLDECYMRAITALIHKQWISWVITHTHRKTSNSAYIKLTKHQVYPYIENGFAFSVDNKPFLAKIFSFFILNSLKYPKISHSSFPFIQWWILF